METSQIPRRLYKSRQHRMIDGICGGIAEYFDVDPTIVRIVWVLITLAGGLGFVLYLIAMIIMPVNPAPLAAASAPSTGSVPTQRNHYAGIILILVGCFFLLNRLRWLFDIGWWDISGKIVFPICLILVGVLFLYTHMKKSNPQTQGQDAAGMATPSAGGRELRRSMVDKKICGVCGGIAEYFNVDPTIVRIIFVGCVLASFGLVVLLYIALCIIMPEQRPSSVNPS